MNQQVDRDLAEAEAKLAAREAMRAENAKVVERIRFLKEQIALLQHQQSQPKSESDPPQNQTSGAESDQALPNYL